VLLFAALCAPAAAFEAPVWQGDQALPGCGICYPGGYDLNTVGSVEGTVVGIEFPDEGPVRIAIVGQGERWIVLASPAWYWRTTGLRLITGGSVTVRGSKTLGEDGALYLVAHTIRPAEAEAAVAVRDGQGRPLWSGGRHGGGNSGAGRRAGQGRGRGSCRP
jgi:hypothetical protein